MKRQEQPDIQHYLLELRNSAICTVSRLRNSWTSILQLVALILLMTFLVRPPGVLVVLGEPQQVQTTNPKVGVHTRLMDEVELWKIQRTLVLAREMGAAWIVEYFPWAYIEPEAGHYDWSHSDAIIAHAANQGLMVIARLGMVPEWARPDPEIQETTFTYLDEPAYEQFAAYAAAFAARYGDTVPYIIIWNEPNLSYEWGFRPVDPESYVKLLATVYPLVHQAHPNVKLLAGALAPTLEPEGSPAGLNDLLYLERIYEADGAAYFDGLAAHAYGLVFPPEAAPAPELLNFRRVELLRELMVRYGDADKPVFVTEGGWNDHPRWTWSVKPAQRVTYSLGAYALALDQWSWCPAVALWVFRTPTPLRNYQDYFAFVTSDFRERPIYTFAQQEFTVNK